MPTPWRVDQEPSPEEQMALAGAEHLFDPRPYHVSGKPSRYRPRVVSGIEPRQATRTVKVREEYL